MNPIISTYQGISRPDHNLFETQFDSIQRINDRLHKENFLKKLLEPCGTFGMRFLESINNAVLCGFEKKNLSHSEIVVPKSAGLEKIVSHYFNKYKICIHLCNNTFQATLDLFKELADKIQKPLYLGIILIDPSEVHLHVTPLLCYFSGQNGLRDTECLILDSVYVEKNTLCDILFSLKSAGLSLDNIYTNSTARQADGFSCRVEATILLRNALLHIYQSGFKGGFSQVLKYGKLEGKRIVHLPPEWDYTAQIENPLINDQKVIRRFFSSKKKDPLTVLEFRKHYQRKMTFKYKVGSSEPVEVTNIEIPQNIQFTLEKGWSKIEFETIRTGNSYLFEKGWKFLKKFKSIQP